jgi:hypothetical protein
MKYTEKTANHLTNYIGDILTSNELDAKFCAYMLEFTFGEKIHKQIDGFINFAKDEKIEQHEIRFALAHDLGGALRKDSLMMPRVSDYADYSTLQ